jgi:hypothetical protein
MERTFKELPDFVARTAALGKQNKQTNISMAPRRQTRLERESGRTFFFGSGASSPSAPPLLSGESPPLPPIWPWSPNALASGWSASPPAPPRPTPCGPDGPGTGPLLYGATWISEAAG